MTLKEAILFLPLYAALAFLLYMQQCNGSARADRTITHRDSSFVYLQDTSNHVHITNNLVPAATVTVPVPGNIDTAAVLAAFYRKNFYEQDLGDSLISISTKDCVQCNGISYSNIAWHFKKPYEVIKTVTITETKEIEKRNGLYLGAFIEANKQTFIGAGPAADFVFNKNNFGAGVDLLNRSAQLKYTRKLGK